MSDTETRDFSFGAKAKRTLAKLRPRSSSEERDGNEKLGEEFEEHVETTDICDLTQRGGSCGV